MYTCVFMLYTLLSCTNIYWYFALICASLRCASLCVYTHAAPNMEGPYWAKTLLKMLNHALSWKFFYLGSSVSQVKAIKQEDCDNYNTRSKKPTPLYQQVSSVILRLFVGGYTSGCKRIGNCGFIISLHITFAVTRGNKHELINYCWKYLDQSCLSYIKCQIININRNVRNIFPVT